ncbi:MAG TPA: class I SAM-dependent methyltransferase [Methylomirabilota bacterium]|nr:class I SAM-dependent methyltransferase [Methylomirabilota bacterium]
MTAARTDYAGHRVDLRESRVRKLLRLLEGERPGRLLDVGCAGGELAALLAERGWKAHGAEGEPALVEAARARGVDARAMDLDRAPLPWPDGAFDAVIAAEVIEHVVDTDRLLAEMARVLRPGGVLVVTTPNLASLENRLRLLLGRYPMWMDVGVAGTGHLRYYTPRMLRHQLGAHGFRVERHVGNWVPFVPQRLLDDRRAPWLAVTGDWWPSLAMGILMKARRAEGERR